MSDFPYTPTQHGFRWGELCVEFGVSDPKWGVVILVGTAHEQWQVRVSPKGRNVEFTKREKAHWFDD